MSASLAGDAARKLASLLAVNPQQFLEEWKKLQNSFSVDHLFKQILASLPPNSIDAWCYLYPLHIYSVGAKILND
jgi:hypothetical protein